MKHAHVFDISLELLFSRFSDHLLQEFSQGTVTESIQGSHYKKRIKSFANNYSRVSIAIEKYEENSFISVSTKNDKEVFTSNYRFIPHGEKTELMYEERYQTDEFLRGMNHLIMRFVLQKKVKNRMLSMFNAIENLAHQAS